MLSFLIELIARVSIKLQVRNVKVAGAIVHLLSVKHFLHHHTLSLFLLDLSP